MLKYIFKRDISIYENHMYNSILCRIKIYKDICTQKLMIEIIPIQYFIYVSGLFNKFFF